MQTIRAILLMILSMALLALSDLFVKLSSQTAPVGQIMVSLSLGGTVLLALYAGVKRAPLISRDFFHPMVLLRNGFEMVAGVFLVLAIAYVPLTTFAAIMQVAPILVVMGGALFLGETVGWRRWAAVSVGLLGMLIVIRPGTDGVSLAVLFAVIAVSGLAARDLVTRLAPPRIHALSLSTWGFGATMLPALVIVFWQGAPMVFDPETSAYLVLAVLVTTAGYLAITTAMRMAPVSIVAPFRYTRLIFTTALGLIFLGEQLDRPTVVGAALILAAGLYTFLRERRLALA